MKSMLEERKSRDRRDDDLGPPAGRGDRRWRAERRTIQVEEAPFEDWVSSAVGFLASRAAPGRDAGDPAKAIGSAGTPPRQPPERRVTADRRSEQPPSAFRWHCRRRAQRRTDVQEVSLEEWVISRVRYCVDRPRHRADDDAR